MITMVAHTTQSPCAHLISIRNKPEVRAFLDMISFAEGTNGSDGYNTVYGSHERLKDLKDHPGKVIHELSRGKALSSSAAGRYQFLHKTWDELVERYHFKNFGPFDQDLAAIALLHNINAISDIENKDIPAAISKACTLWASLPGSPYGQPTKSLDALMHVWGERYAHYSSGVKR